MKLVENRKMVFQVKAFLKNAIFYQILTLFICFENFLNSPSRKTFLTHGLGIEKDKNCVNLLLALYSIFF